MKEAAAAVSVVWYDSVSRDCVRVDPTVPALSVAAVALDGVDADFPDCAKVGTHPARRRFTRFALFNLEVLLGWGDRRHFALGVSATNFGDDLGFLAADGGGLAAGGDDQRVRAFFNRRLREVGEVTRRLSGSHSRPIALVYSFGFDQSHLFIRCFVQSHSFIRAQRIKKAGALKQTTSYR